MVQKPNHRWIFAFLIAFSLFSFVFVNSRSSACCSENCSASTELLEKEQLKEEEEKTGKFAVPDLTAIEKVLRVVQRFAGGRN